MHEHLDIESENLVFGRGILAIKIRTVIAEHLRVDVDSIGVDSHFRDDLGLDLLDVVELTILLEEELVNREITDANEELEFVGDLIHHIEVYQPG
jgi:acyl carrier protein